MIAKLILLFTIVPFIELFLLIELGSRIGTLSTLVVVVATGIIGALMARAAGIGVVSKIQESLRAGIVPRNELFDGILILVGGALLITPGLLTDAGGFFLLIPSGRAMVKRWLRGVVRKSVAEGTIVFWDRWGY